MNTAQRRVAATSLYADGGARTGAVCQDFASRLQRDGCKIFRVITRGCHMKLPAQILVTCHGHKELVSCINCGRILYYTRDMALSAAE